MPANVYTPEGVSEIDLRDVEFQVFGAPRNGWSEVGGPDGWSEVGGPGLPGPENRPRGFVRGDRRCECGRLRLALYGARWARLAKCGIR